MTSADKPPLRPSHEQQRVSRLGLYLFVVPALIYIALTTVYPVFSNLYMSLFVVDQAALLSGDWSFAGLSNYARTIGDPEFLHAFGLSLLFTVGCTLLQFTLGFALALFFDRPFPGNGVLRAAVLLAWVLPHVVSGTVFRWMLDGEYGVVNSVLQGLGLLDDPMFWLINPNTALLGTIAANVWVGIPFYMVLLLAGLQGVSPSLYEAAKIDGAGTWQRFRYVTLPLMRPVVLSTVLLGIIYTFKAFDIIYIMTQGGPENATTVLPLHIYELSFNFFRFSEGATAATLLLLSMVGVAMVYLWASRREEAA